MASRTITMKVSIRMKWLLALLLVCRAPRWMTKPFIRVQVV